MNFYSHILDVDKQKLMLFYKSIDKNKTGLISYKTFHKFIKNHCSEYEGCYLLHLKYWANSVNNDFNGKFKEYLIYKNLVGNKYLNYDNYSMCFKLEECLNDDDLIKITFNYLKEKDGIHENMVYVQNLIDYLKILVGIDEDGMFNNFEEEIFEEDNCEYDKKNIIETIKSIINNVEENQNFTDIYDVVNFSTEVNSFSKINYKNMRKKFIDEFAFTIERLKIFKDYFCKVPLLFDLFKLCEILQKYSKFSCNLKEIKNKILKKIPKEKTSKNFFKEFNLNEDQPLNLCEFVLFNSKIFDLKNYETFYLFYNLFSNEKNSDIDILKVREKFMLEFLNLNKDFKEEIEEEKDSDYISPLLDLALKRLKRYLINTNTDNKSMKNFFKNYDENSNKKLEREEFFNLLSECKINGLNDNMKVKILNYIDRNGDGTIDYKEFINFINNYPDDDDEDFVNEEFSEVGDKNNFEEQSSHEPFEKYPKDEEENKEEEEINTKLKVPKKIKKEKEEEENEEEQENEENENKEEEEENEEKEEENEEKEEEENLLISLKTIKENYNFNKTQMNSKLVPNLDKKLTKLQENIIKNYPNHIEKDIKNFIELNSTKKNKNKKNNDIINLKDLKNIIEEKTSIKFSINELKNINEDINSNSTTLENFCNFIQNYFFTPVQKNSAIQDLAIHTNARLSISQKISNTYKIFSHFLKKNVNDKINFDENNLNKIQKIMMRNFAYKRKIDNNLINNKNNENIYGVKKLIKRISQTQLNKLYDDYQFKESDFYYKIRNGEKIKMETILTNERAALKKIEEIIFNLDSNKNENEDENFNDDSNKLFTDPEFGGNEKTIESIYLDENEFSSDLNYTPLTVEWLRLTELIERPYFKNYSNFNNENNENNIVTNNVNDNFNPSIIIQGNLGDKWFLNALSIVSSKKYLLFGECHKFFLIF
jgi:hypothetical protein